MTPTRPILRYHGAKWRITPWLLEFFPSHKVYVEPFGGGASVLLRKPRSFTEIYNELDWELYSLFKVLRDPAQSARLREALEYTPYSRAEYEAAYEPTECPVEQARRTLIKTWFGTFSKGLMNKSGFDTRVNGDGFCSRVGTFVKLPDLIEAYRERLAGVVIENTDALQLIPRMDAGHTLFYVDPPYTMDSRSGRYYRHEMTNDDHRRLAEVLHRCKGMVIISGYPSPLYDDLYGDWHCEECAANTDGAHARTEVIWINPAAWGQKLGQQYLIFAG
jgi:DNA adenine methylase